MRAIAGAKTSYLFLSVPVRLISNGKNYLFCGLDELHGYKTWDIRKAMQGDPMRTDVMIWITRHATFYHKPDIRLCDLSAQGKKA